MNNMPMKPVLVAGTTDIFPSIEYATGFKAPGAVVYLRTGGNKYLVVPQMEFGRATRTGVDLQVFTPEMLGLDGPAKGQLQAWTLRLLRHLRIKNVVVPALFPVGVARYLEKHGIGLSIATAELFPERAVKSFEELRKICESQQAAVIAMRAAIALITDSKIDSAGCLRMRGKVITSEQVRELIGRILFEHNCSAKDTIVACGSHAADPHEAGSGPLRAGETIVMDIFPRNLTHGYWGDLTRTIVKGSASSFMKSVYHAVKAAQAAGMAHVKAGVKCSTVHRAVVNTFNRRGFYNSISDGMATGFIHSTGHGVGLAIHEAPSISMAAEGRLRCGNVITIEPGLYYHGIGGIRIEDTIVVTSTGWRYLVPCEKKFEI